MFKLRVNQGGTHEDVRSSFSRVLPWCIRIRQVSR